MMDMTVAIRPLMTKPDSRARAVVSDAAPVACA